MHGVELAPVEDRPPPERRRYPRRPVSLEATLIFAGQHERCALVDLSLGGAGLSRPAFVPFPGDHVELFLERVGWFKARVARITPKILGLEFLVNEVERARLANVLSLRPAHLH